MPQRRIGPGEFEQLAHEAADALDPGGDQNAMAMIFNLIRITNRITRDLEVEVHRPAGISFAAYRLLFSIRAAGSTHTNELARLSSVSTASMSSLLQGLDRRGLVRRRPDSEDGRRSIVQLSEAGEEMLAELLHSTNERERLWSKGLTGTERDILVSLLRKLLLYHPQADAE